MANTRARNTSKRKPAVRKSSSRRTSTVAKKKPVARKTSSQTWYVVDSKGQKTNLKIVATKK